MRGHDRSAGNTSLPHEGYDSSLVVLALAMLQAKVSYLDSRDEPHLPDGGHLERTPPLGQAPRAYLVKLGEYLAAVAGEGDEHGQVSQGHQGYVGLGVRPEYWSQDSNNLSHTNQFHKNIDIYKGKSFM